MKTKLLDGVIALLGAFGAFYPFQAVENFWLGLVSGFVAAGVVATIIWRTIRKAREITVPEALAYGYFGSFLEPVVAKTAREAVIEEDGERKSYSGEKVQFKILIPDSLDALGHAFDVLKHRHRSASLIIEAQAKPYGVYVNDDGDGIIVADVPNTLRALKTYLRRQYGDLETKKGWFRKKSIGQAALNEFTDALDGIIDEHKDQSDALRKRVLIEKVKRKEDPERAA